MTEPEKQHLASCQFDSSGNRNTSAKVIECCLDDCAKYVDFCFEKCHGTYGPSGKTPDPYLHEKCHLQCKQIVQNCENVCFSYPSPSNDNVLKCKQNNENDILQCCTKACSTSDNSCAKECRDSISFFAKQSPLEILEKSFDKKDLQLSKKSKNIFNIFIIILIVVFVILLFLKLKNL
jgi:hypothetical protein